MTWPIKKMVMVPVALLMCWAATGCADEYSDLPEEVHLVEVAGFPYEIPNATIHVGSSNAEGSLVYSYWLSEGEWGEWESQGIPQDTESIRTKDAKNTLINIDTPFAPIQIEVIQYSEIGADGFPSGLLGRGDCLDQDYEVCSYHLEGDAVRIPLHIYSDTTVVIINPAWPVPHEYLVDQEAQWPEVTASWVFLTEGT
ncbi:hypothetical protein [Natronoglycomyces albus]|uniref:Uncharacterized protein n=1 Tax=Natronoglycomyces albus TaxID=2811108 RepID=A0A895XVR3_9ACTN|nr:hypothetical protein [Natronoglycomyces albus]QSB06310.1 hypothetical protein JQS30_05215 [Natronoglycomyces albus]